MAKGRLQDKVAIVTGSGRNIGRAIALALADDGACIVVNSRSNHDEAKAVAREVETVGPKALVHVGDIADPAATPAEQAERQSRDAQIRSALAALPARQREALVLNYYQELSNIEAAALMGISIDALESLLARARRNLRALLVERGEGKEAS